MEFAPRITVRGILIATFWVAVFFTACMLLRRTTNNDDHLPFPARNMIALATFCLVVATPFIAGGTLVGRQKDGIIVGLFALAVVEVATVMYTLIAAAMFWIT